jgi:signal transduction histidine kinase/CheY-like chemotaxis protein
MREHEDGRAAGGELDAAAGARAVEVPAVADAPSLAELREAILRRIMQAACAVGAVSLGFSAAFVRPFDAQAGLVGVVAIVLVFGTTLLPRRLGVLSLVYPWALALTALSMAWRLGPRPEPFILACGALFIGSLVLDFYQLALVVVVGLLGGSAALHLAAGPSSPGMRALWINAVGTMLSVVLPASIAGRMIVTALSRALKERGELVASLLEQSRVRERTLEQLEMTRSQLTHAQKMELIGQMAGGIAHDMNNALTAILGEASMLGPRAPDARERIEDAASHAAKLTHQLMVFGRRETSQPRPIDLSATVRDQLKALRRLLTSEITLESSISADPVPVVADPNQLLQVLLNLTGNARDAMEGSGTLTIVVSHDAAGKRAAVEVRDTGAGIPESVFARIFEPFFTTKPPGKGTGLGLANVKQLVTAMGGTVEVSSTPGQGTTFTISLPTTDEPISRPTKELKHRARASGTVLVVDDDVRVRATIFTALERRGYHVLEAATPEGTRALLASSSEKIDLLLTDVVMPGGGGAEVIRAVRAKFPDIAVLVMSGYNDDESLRLGIERGTFPFIAKPFTADALAHAVEEALVPDTSPPAGPVRAR